MRRSRFPPPRSGAAPTIRLPVSPPERASSWVCEPSAARTPSPLNPAADSVAPSSAIAAGSPTSSGPLVTDGLGPTRELN